MGTVLAFLCLAIIVLPFIFAAAKAKQKGQRRMQASRSMPVAPSKPDVDPSLTGDDCWVPPGRELASGQWVLPGGMIYVGHGLQAGVPSYRCAVEPALLDPTLPVAPPGSRRLMKLPYWPQYDQMTPQQRSGMLDWLAGGRCDPNEEMGIVFLFFYGLERRLIVDGVRDGSSAVREEAPALIREIERLQSIYGSNRSFRRYSTQLLVFAQVVYLGRLEFSAELNPNDREPEPSVRILLGQMAINGDPVPWNLALHWYITSDDQRLRTPAHRCWPLFLDLFEQRYKRRFGHGMVIKPNKTKLKIPYTPASPGLTGAAGHLHIPVDGLPDVMRLKRPLQQVAAIVDQCQNDLEPYSRWIGRNPDAKGSLEAAAHLPPELAVQEETPEVQALRREFESRLAQNPMHVCRSDFLFKHWATTKPGKMRKQEAVALAQLAEHLGYGMEPDPRFGGPPLASDMPVVLFRQPQDQVISAPSDEYASAMLVLQLAALVAAADGSVDHSEEQVLEQHLEEALDLNDGERLRLSAHLRWVTASGPRFTGLKKRLAQLDQTARHEIADFAVAMAHADGKIDPSEIKVLRRIYSMLELNPDDVYGHVHGANAGVEPARAPVRVRAGTQGTSGHAIPSPPNGGPSHSGERHGIDMDRVRKKLQETAHVSAMLSEIFAEDEGEHATSATAAPTEAAVSTTLDGLDAAQTAFLQSLLTKAEWSQDEVERLAAQHDVMLDGTVEAINELAFEHVDQPIIEWDDPVEIDVETAKELWA